MVSVPKTTHNTVCDYNLKHQGEGEFLDLLSTFCLVLIGRVKTLE